MSVLLRWTLLSIAFIGAGGCSSGVDSPLAPAPAALAAPDPAWEAAFTRTSGWNGGDIAHSIDLRDGRTLWLFGDSIFGPVQGNARVGESSRMLRAGIAWHPTPAHGDAPDPGSVRFAAPEPFGETPVAEWARPRPGLFPEGTWYWLMNDAVRLRGPRDRLVLFVTAIGPSGNPDGMWNFRRVGGAMVTIDNPAEPPDRWIGEQAVQPLVTPTPAHGAPPSESENHALAVVEWPPGSGLHSIFGVHADIQGVQRLTVSEARAEDIATPRAWRASSAGAGSGANAGAPPMPRVPDEFTVEVIVKDGRDVLVLISSEPFANRTIWARTALRPEGPWSGAVAIYEIPDHGPGTFAYAAKGHAHLSRPGELLVTYAVNADFDRVIHDPSIYRPRFVRVPLALLPEPPG